VANLDDILTTQKNGVVALNSISSSLLGIFDFSKATVLNAGAATTGSYATLYTVPSSIQMAIVDIEICNAGSTSETFSISFVPAAGTAGSSNALFYNAPINPNTTVQWTGKQVLTGGQTVRATASSTNVTFKVTGGPG
jgi:hypothetical protein